VADVPTRRKSSGRHGNAIRPPMITLVPPRRAKPRPDAWIHEAPAALTAGAPILTANPKVRVSVFWLPKRNPLRTEQPAKGSGSPAEPISSWRIPPEAGQHRGHGLRNPFPKRQVPPFAEFSFLGLFLRVYSGMCARESEPLH
jgi:hypothetical protein